MRMLNGFLLINKPAGMSSFDCIRKLKKLLPKNTKIGHAGTLDLLASGLLLIGIGKATKLLHGLSNETKQYTVKACLGELRDSLDQEGELIRQDPLPVDAAALFEKAFHSFPESYNQIPPAYSALKFEGAPLYKLARKKILDQESLDSILATKGRMVRIFDRSLDELDLPFFTFTVTVSKGTYVRSLAHDIAQQVDMVATTHMIKRSQIGSYTLNQAHELIEFESMDDIEKRLQKVTIEKQD